MEKMNKKGQEMSIGTLILIILGLIVLVVLILGFTTGFGFITDLFSKAPGDLEQMTQACIQYAGADLYSDYCKEFREATIFGKSGFFNCQYGEFQAGIKAETAALTCSTRFSEYVDADKSAIVYCNQLKASGKFNENTLVNGLSCASRGVKP